MAGRAFTIAHLLQPLKVSLNIPAFLGDKDQLSHAAVAESQTIAAVQIDTCRKSHSKGQNLSKNKK